jgi:hypothetical protein
MTGLYFVEHIYINELLTSLPSFARPGRWDTCPHVSVADYFTASYLLGRGVINETSTGSNSNFGSSASGANVAFVVFNQFSSSRSGKSGL